LQACYRPPSDVRRRCIAEDQAQLWSELMNIAVGRYHRSASFRRDFTERPAPRERGSLKEKKGRGPDSVAGDVCPPGMRALPVSRNHDRRAASASGGLQITKRPGDRTRAASCVFRCLGQDRTPTLDPSNHRLTAEVPQLLAACGRGSRHAITCIAPLRTVPGAS
jgi:hypothetical protein